MKALMWFFVLFVLAMSAQPATVVPIVDGVRSLGAVSIGDSTNADSHSLLDIRSTSKGALLPRMTTTQRNAISSPPSMMLIENTSTNTVDIYIASAWVALADISSSQTLTNKSMSGSANTFTNIGNSSLSSGITRSKLANGTAYRLVVNDSGGVISENAAITASRALASDANGQPVAATTTATELGYVSGVTSAIQTQLNGKQATGNYITALTGDVTAAGPGSVAATVALVGGSSASNVHAAELLANAATNLNTVSTIVKRDGSGNFVAGTISAALSGNASTATALASTPTACASNTFASSIAASGNLGCTSVPNAATTATSANTASAIVARDGSGNFTAGTITASLTGTASGNTTYTANNHGVVLSGSANTMSVLAPDSSTTKALISGGASANPSWGVLAIGGGGTGQSTQSAGFDALSPMTTGGDVIYGGSSGTGTRLANGSAGQFLKSNGGTLAPSWAAASVVTAPPSVQTFVSGSGTYNLDYTFVITAGSATVGATYTNNAVTFTVHATVASATQVVMSGSGPPATSGTLTKASGTGDATLTFSQFLTPLYLEVELVGGGGGGGGSGSSASNGGDGGNTTFGTLTGGGGGKGFASNTGSTGGTATGGDVNLAGNGSQGGAGATNAPGTTGASSFFGSGGTGEPQVQGGNGIYGGGGAGGGTAATVNTGGGGAAGGYVRKVFGSPSATYSYAIGAAGSAGGAGTGGSAGGTGGAGLVIATARYQ